MSSINTIQAAAVAAGARIEKILWTGPDDDPKKTCFYPMTGVEAAVCVYFSTRSTDFMNPIFVFASYAEAKKFLGSSRLFGEDYYVPEIVTA